MVGQQLVIDGVRMIEIRRVAIVQRHVLKIAIVQILLDENDFVSADEVVFIQQDLYYRNLKDMPLDYRNAANFDHPDAIDNELLAHHLKRLRSGEPVDITIYDFRTHTPL